MTNSTIVSNMINNATNSTTEGNNMTNATVTNNSTLTSILTANLFHELNDAQPATLVSCALVDAIAYPEDFAEMFMHILSEASMTVRALNEEGKYVDQAVSVEVDGDAIGQALIKLDYMTDEGEIGTKLQELMETSKERYAPTLATNKIERRFPMYAPEKGQVSPLTIEAIEALESVNFTIDQYMVDLANLVQTKTGGSLKDDEAYVLAGCNEMDAEHAYNSEFKADRRSRLYQAACHGPNGQASDRSRALMDLAGVTTDYDVTTVRKAILAEMEDMLGKSDLKTAAKERKALGDVQFIITNLQTKGVKKPWSFVKAARIMSELQAGNRPYIGMAVGLDAKCSGPQLGALMSGDQLVAAACGFSNITVDDAYELAIQELDKAGFKGFTRGGVKKSYMGIFYGQGYAAFTQIEALLAAEQFEIVEILYPTGVANDDTAKRFHAAITNSFGKQMKIIRDRFKSFAGKIEGRTSHFMPDGFKVAMNYKVKHNIFNTAIEFGVDSPDVTVTTSESTHKFIKFAVKTLEVHTGDFVRNGFVNMIQATDALIAKLIIVNLKRLGAQHIIAVHDCFRVNVTETHLLERAIINAYTQLFGSETNCKTKDLPMGQDIMGLYFEGMSKSMVEGEKVVPMSQFLPIKSAARKLKSVNGVKVQELINNLGTSCYFAK